MTLLMTLTTTACSQHSSQCDPLETSMRLRHSSAENGSMAPHLVCSQRQGFNMDEALSWPRCLICHSLQPHAPPTPLRPPSPLLSPERAQDFCTSHLLRLKFFSWVPALCTPILLNDTVMAA